MLMKSDDEVCLYHFTDERNLESIRKLGGLYSWRYLMDHNVDLSFAGGDELSRYLDIRRADLSDYVRLSFAKYHPMIYRLLRAKRPLVLLKVSTQIYSDDDLVCCCNATDNNARLITMSDFIDDPMFEDFVNFNAVERNNVYKSEGSIFKEHQAELLIKTCVPLDYILNLDNPERLYE